MRKRSDPSNARGFIWGPIVGAALLATAFAGLETFLDFVPLNDPQIGGWRVWFGGLETIAILGGAMMGATA